MILWQRQYESEGASHSYDFEIITNEYNVASFKANTRLYAIHFLIRLNE